MQQSPGIPKIKIKFIIFIVYIYIKKKTQH
jgi:hypothetical protein